jgi:hypothetical protein
VTDAGVPLKVTVDVLVKPTPLIVTAVPAGPVAGAIWVIDSSGVKPVALVPVPAAVVTDSAPGGAPFGTVAVTLVGEATAKLAACVPKRTMLAPLKLVPVIVTEAPVMSDVGVNELIVGATCAVLTNDAAVVTVPTGADVFVTLI